MLRVVERVLGEGDVFRDGRRVARTGYELTLYRAWTDVGGRLAPRHFEVEGHLLGDQLGLCHYSRSTAILKVFAVDC